MNSENKDQSENSSITQSQPNISPINQFNPSLIPEETQKNLITLLKKRLDRKLSKFEHKIKEDRETLKFVAKKFTEFEKTLIALTEGVKETQKANEEKVKKKDEEKKQKEQKEILKTHTSKSQAHKKLKIETKNNYLTNRTVLNINKNKNNVNNISSTRYNYHTEVPKKEHVRPKTFKGRRPNDKEEISKIKVKPIKVDKIENVSTPVRLGENKAKTILTLSTDQKLETKKIHNSVINNKSKSIKKKIIPKNMELTKNFSEVDTHVKKVEEFKSEKPEKKSIHIIQDKLNKKHENKKGTGKKTVIKKTNDKNKKPQVKKEKREEEKKEKNNIEEPKNEIKENKEIKTNKEEDKKDEKEKEEEKKIEKEDNKTIEIIKDNEENKEEIKEEKKEEVKEVEKLPEKKEETESKNENVIKPEEKEENKIEEANINEKIETKKEEPKKEEIITPITKEEEKKIEKTEPIEQKDNIINKDEPPKEEKNTEPDKKEEIIKEEKKPEEKPQELNQVISEEEILKSLKEEEQKIIKENEANNLLITKEQEEPKKEETESPTETKPLEGEEKKNDEINNENKPQKENNENVIEMFKKHNEEVKENEEELLKHYQSQLIDINLNQSINQNMSFSQSFLQSRSILGETPQEKIARDPNAPLTRDEILKKYKNYFIYVFDFLDFKERIMFSGIHKGFKNERIYLLNTKREEAIASLELKERETLNDRINKFMTSYSKSEYTKPLGKFSVARNSANAILSIDKEMFSKIFKQKVLDIKLSDIYIVYRVLFVLIGEPKIAEIVDDGEFWIKCIEYLNTNANNKIGSFILEKSKNFDFSHKSIYLLNKLLVGIKPKFNPASFSKINGTTGLVIFIIKDALEYAGILVSNKTPKNRIYDNLMYYKNLIEPLTNFIDFLSKIKVDKK